MPYRCKGRCDSEKEPSRPGIYDQGFKWCSICSSFMRVFGRRCPCCGVMMRLRRHNSHDRAAAAY